MDKRSELLAKLLKAKGIQKQRPVAFEGRTIPVLEKHRGEPIISFAQQRLWFIDKLEEQAAIYTLPLALSIDGPLNPEALSKSLATIVTRHECLRTVFAEFEGQPRPVVLDEVDWNLELSDLSGFASEAQNEVVEKIINSELHKAFDLSRDIPFRGRLLKLAKNRYLLLMTMHHIAADGWALGVLLKELEILYAADVAPQAKRLPELVVQYKDYSAWQRQWLKGEVTAQQLKYWQQQLADLPQLHGLPLDMSRPLRQTYRGKVYRHTLPADLVQQLRSLSRIQGTTLFVVMQTAFAALIGRWSGENDIVMGTAIANRLHSATESMIGLFVNSLVLRNDLSGDPSFQDLLLRSIAMHNAAMQHQDLPFDILVENLCPNRCLAHSPLFQLMIVYNQQEAISLPQLSISEFEFEYPIAKFDLTLHINDGEELRIFWEYNSDLFFHETIERFSGHYETLLRELMTKLDQPTSSLLLLNITEQKLLLDWGGMSNNFVATSVVSQFESQVAAFPTAAAVRCGNNILNYEELNARANQWAVYLQANGIVREQRVGLCLPRSIDLIVGMIAILKAGAAYVPIDPNIPLQRLAFLLRDAEVKVILTDTTHQSILPKFVKSLCMDGVDEATDLELSSCDNLLLELDRNHLAYVIYTSGSTGLPKGVMIEHGSITRLVCDTNFITLDRQTKMLQSAALAFDAATFEIWGALLNGGELILYPSEYLDVALLSPIIKKYGINTLWLTAALFDQWVVQLNSRTVPASMRYVLTGGDVVSPVSVKRLYDLMPEGTIINGYGPTENTTFTSCYPVPRSFFEHKSVPALPIGKAINGTEVYVLDEQQNLAVLGSVGELYVGGAGLARGYLATASSQEERFVTLSNVALAGRRLYRTGDRVRYGLDGNLEYWGRSDNQVKIRGFRVELGEIEKCLVQHPAVSECAVVVIGKNSGKYLAAYIVLFDDIPRSEIHAHLRKYLPNYMVPSTLVRLEELPITNNGKVDRIAILQEEILDWDIEEQQTDPLSEKEKVLAEIWLQLLPVDSVSVTGNFFEYGGHSLMASQLVALVRKNLQLEIPLAVVFQQPTIFEQAQWIEANIIDSRPMGLEPHEGEAVMSFAQHRLWFIDQLEGQAAIYSVPYVVSLQGELNNAALGQSLSTVLTRHESLRTVFKTEDGVARPVVLPVTELPLAMADVSKLSEFAQQEEIQLIVKNEIHKPFNLSTDLMLRVLLVKRAENDHLLIMNMHHIAFDGWSLGIMARELQILYGTYEKKLCNPLPPLHVQYQDYAAFQRQWLQEQVVETQLAYWLQQLAGLPQIHSLPLDKPRPLRNSYRGACHRQTLPSELVCTLRAFARSESTTLFVVLQTVLAALFSRWSGESDIVMGTPVANRSLAGSEELIGFFANTLVLRTDVSEHPCFKVLLQRNMLVHQAAQSNQDLPFDVLVERLSPIRHLAHSSLFQLMIVFNQETPFALPGLAVSEYDFNYAVSKFDLTLHITDGDKLSLLWEYNTDLFNTETIMQLAERYERLLSGVMSAPELPIASLSLLNIREQHQLLQWGESQAISVVDSLVTRFEMQVSRTPDAVAVSYEGQCLSYLQLNCLANQWASYLLAKGFVAERSVGLCVSRSMNLVVAILAILKAGGAYVPLDPTNPPERIKYIISDASLDLVISESAYQGFLPSNIDQILMDGTGEIASLQLMSKENLGLEIITSHLAYIIYTSGSTGLPKGVMVEHGNVVRLFDCTEHQFQFSQHDCWTMFHSYAFDFSVWEIWGALIYGGKLVVVPFDVARSPVDFYELLKAERVTVLNQTPSAFQMLNEIDSQHAEKLPLRYVIFGGESLDPKKLLSWGRKYGVEEPSLINMYGITETTVHVTYKKLQLIELELGQSNIGKPLSDLGVYVCNDIMSLQPVGVAGEMYVRGKGVTRGYLNRLDLNAERFIDNPFDAKDFSKLYRTGDLVRWHQSGDLEFLGRIDHQVKLRGFRIELGEIETNLRRSKYVKESLVIMDEDQSGEPHLTAYIVAATDRDHDELSDELREFLLQRVPYYMVPAYFVALKAFPLTNNGKINKGALPKPAQLKRNHGSQVEPDNNIEKKLQLIWQQVLHKETLGVTDNFFALGGDSIKAVQVTSVAIKQDLHLQTKHIFEYQTIRELAEYLSHSGGKMAQAKLQVPLHLLEHSPLFSQSKYSGVEDRYPVTCLQKMMLDEHMRKKQGTYHPQHLFEIKQKSFDEHLFISAIRQSVRLNPTLRTRFERFESGEYLQHVLIDPNVKVDIVDLSDINCPDRMVSNHIEEEKAQGFDYDKDELLIKFKLFKLNEECYQFLVSTHHAIEDGWGFIEWIKFVFERYQCLKYNACYETKIIVANVFKEHVALELEASTSDTDNAVWKSLMKSYQVMPELRIKKAGPVPQGIIGIELDQETLESLTEFSRTRLIPLKTLFLHSYMKALAKFVCSNNVTIDVVFNGRSNRLSDPLNAIGLFWNMLPINVNFEQDNIIILKDKISLAEAHAIYPRDKVAAIANMVEPTYAAFNYVHFHNEVILANEEKFGVNLKYSSDRFHHPLKLLVSVNPNRDRATLQIEYDKSYFCDADAKYLKEYIEHELFRLQCSLQNSALSVY